MTVYIGCIHARRFTPFHTHMTVFYSFLPTTVHTGAPAHDGLGRAALVRRFKRVLNRRTKLDFADIPSQRTGQASRAAEPHTSIDPAFPVWCCPLADRSTALHGRTANSLLSHGSRILWTTAVVHTTYVAHRMGRLAVVP
jgi:hypothetical protein